MPVLASSGWVTLVVAEYEPGISQSTKIIVDVTGIDEDISLDLSMRFPTPPLVGGIHPVLQYGRSNVSRNYAI